MKRIAGNGLLNTNWRRGMESHKWAISIGLGKQACPDTRTMRASGIKLEAVLHASVIAALTLLPLLSQAAGIIAFDSDSGNAADIYTINDDGTGRTRVTPGVRKSLSPNWSPDGRRIAYMHLNTSGGWDIYTINLDGSGAFMVAGSGYSPCWSPDGTMLAYTRNNNPWVVNTNGSGSRVLYSQYGAPKGWSPDSQYLLIELGSGGWFDLYRIARDGSGLTKLPTDGVQSGFATPAKVGNKWVYRWAWDYDQPATIMTINLDGSSKFSVAAVGTALGHMFFSPDGSKIAFCSDAGGNGINGHLGVVNSSGGAITWLDTGTCQLGYDPAAFPSSPWSPDGQWIVYAAKVGSYYHLFKIRPSGAGKTQLTATPSVDELHAVFSPVTSVDNGLVAYYPFDGNANDASGNGNNGTVLGAALTNDRLGNPNSAYQFDGNTSQIRMNPLPDMTAATFSCWIKVPVLAPNRRYVFFEGDMTSGHDFGFALWNNGSFFQFKDTTELPFPDTDFPIGTWFHFACVADNAAGKVTAWINGLKARELVHSVTANVGYHNNLSIGRFYDPRTEPAFNGALDEVRFYNRALSAAEVQALYNVASGQPALSNVRASQRAGTSLVDVWYDLSGASAPVVVSVSISTDGGVS